MTASAEVESFLKTTASISHPDSRAVIFVREAGRPVPLDPQVRDHYIGALLAESSGNNEKAKGYFTQAAARAKEVFEGIPTQRMTAVDRRGRAQYGELVVISLSSAGEIDSAKEFAQVLLEDPLVPEASRARVAEMVAPAVAA